MFWIVDVLYKIMGDNLEEIEGILNWDEFIFEECILKVFYIFDFNRDGVLLLLEFIEGVMKDKIFVFIFE